MLTVQSSNHHQQQKYTCSLPSACEARLILRSSNVLT